jgi:Dihaem cytochrome c
MNVRRLALAAGLLCLVPAVVAAEENEHRHNRRGADVAPVANPLYAKECGSCHFAYQPGLLPARSWRRLMGNLADHFGESAELVAEDASVIAAYLVANAADRSDYHRSRRIMGSLADHDAPVRISLVPYIADHHEELPARAVKDNPKVKSLSHCAACHTRADKGSYREDEVAIPGYGRWED